MLCPGTVAVKKALQTEYFVPKQFLIFLDYLLWVVDRSAAARFFIERETCN